MKPYAAHLLALVNAYTDADAGQWVLDRLGPDTYPDPAKTSFNDMVTWRVRLVFGRGYFVGARVEYTGRWAEPHGTPGTDEAYRYAEHGRDLPIDEAVALFLTDSIPEWASKP